MKNKLEVPMVHLNGSGKKMLQEQYMNAAEAVGLAVEKVQQSGPHGRDYYIQDGGIPYGDHYGRAMRQHEARVEALRDVYDELLKLYESVV